MKPNYCDLML